MDFELTAEGKKLVDAVTAGHTPLFLTGKAGTGKSTLLRYLRDTLDDLNMAVVAPTGLAALNVGGQTVHSFFRLPVKPIMDETCILSTYGKLQHFYSKLDLLIVDEISMVRVDLMNCVDMFLRTNRPSRGDLPFGGVQILLIGDLFQLPPVVVKDSIEEAILKATYGAPFFFRSPVFKENPLHIHALTKVYRQEDDTFVEILNQIREGGDHYVKALATLNAACLIGDTPYDGVEMVGTNELARLINYRQLRLLDSPPATFTGIKTGVMADGRVDDARLPVPDKLTLKVGAKVMIVRNDLSEFKYYVNGTVGTIVSLPQRDGGMEPIGVRILNSRGDPMIVSITPATWEKTKVELFGDKYSQTVVGAYCQYPLMLAYALTIHKAQGKTLDNVVLDTGPKGMFSAGQLYVALSRVREMKGLKLRRELQTNDVIVHEDVVKFHQEYISKPSLLAQGSLFYGKTN